MRTIFAASNGTGDGSSDASPASWQKACATVGQAGDKLLIRGGDTVVGPLGKKGWTGGVLGVYGRSGSRATIQVSGEDAVTLQLSEDFRISDLDIVDPARDPGRAGFTYSNGFQGIHLINCQRPLLTRLEVRFFRNGIVAEGSAVQGGRAASCTWAENYNDPTEHSQGVYLAGQNGWLFEDCLSDTNGWHPMVPAAKPTMFNHGIYSHDSGAGDCGPYTARRCRFYDDASSGPTADTGAEYDSCVIVNCANDDLGSPNCWVGGPPLALGA